MGPSAHCEHEPLSGIGVVGAIKLEFLRFSTCPRDPLRGSAWSVRQNWFLRFLAGLARPLTLRLPCACLYAFHCLLSLRMPLCVSLSTFLRTHLRPLHLPYACLYAFHCLLSCACLYAFHCRLSLCVAFHCALSLRMPLCVSLYTCPMRASLHLTVHFLHACL